MVSELKRATETAGRKVTILELACLLNLSTVLPSLSSSCLVLWIFNFLPPLMPFPKINKKKKKITQRDECRSHCFLELNSLAF